ncbi:5-carboxymethyl-2-hydroxymuconate delta-isomerase [uncultured Aquitalea sp.]|uniref:5-carboxymethyl-2-hydroxymuconate delta-isomerase n=1 Tax=uncultured Aquitalea sp. TaxID=540272 RepID=UPI0025F2079E|nr:5-carboxymethyl-2-hydroxymuconate delta-isomerase [uncultured Aquitalea sp.]
MPHFIVECTDNIRAEADLPGLFAKAHEFLVGTGLYPLAGIRSRAVWLDTWRMADAGADYAFVHMSLKIGHGRSFEERERTAQGLFAIIKAHFQPLFDTRYLALTFELSELDPVLSYKHNNVHQRFRKD